MTEGFDYRALVDELSCRDTSWLLDHRDELVREQRRLHVRELAVTAVLDRRGAVDDTTAGDDGVSARTWRDRVDTARALEELPAVAAAAYAGELSDEQLTPTVQLADYTTDREWAHRAVNTAPADLNRAARRARKPSSADYDRRHAARSLRMRWDDDRHFLHVHGQLPALQGAIVEDTFKTLVEAMRPAKGQPWARWDQRAADALVQLCEAHGSGAPEGFEPTGLSRRPLFVAEVPLHGPATIAGAPVPDTLLEAWRAEARIEPVVVDEHGEPLAHGRVSSTVSEKQRRAVLVRDGHCRFESCDRTHGLHNHHLWPRSWGGTDDLSNRAAICSGGATDHHLKVVPHGPWLLLGNPNRPDRLHLLHRDDIPDLDHYIRQKRPPSPDELDHILRNARRRPRHRRDRAGPDDP